MTLGYSQVSLFTLNYFNFNSEGSEIFGRFRKRFEIIPKFRKVPKISKGVPKISEEILKFRKVPKVSEAFRNAFGMQDQVPRLFWNILRTYEIKKISVHNLYSEQLRIHFNWSKTFRNMLYFQNMW